MPDNFKHRTVGLDSPARNAEGVTPSDVSELPNSARFLYVGGAGDIEVTTLGDDKVILAAASGFVPISVKQVHAAGTSATGIVALW